MRPRPDRLAGRRGVCAARGTAAAAAHLVRVRLHVLERLEDAEGLVDGAAEAEVVDGGVLEHALLVDDEEAAESDALVVQDLVVGAVGKAHGRERERR